MKRALAAGVLALASWGAWELLKVPNSLGHTAFDERAAAIRRDPEGSRGAARGRGGFPDRWASDLVTPDRLTGRQTRTYFTALEAAEMATLHSRRAALEQVARKRETELTADAETRIAEVERELRRGVALSEARLEEIEQKLEALD